ncbi:MAG: FliM/FliN family flagellar motor switch protein [Phycisphaerae bacterium]
MSFLDQSSVDALLAQVQAEADGVAAHAGAGDAGAVGMAAQKVGDVAGHTGYGMGSSAAAQAAAAEAVANLPDTPEVHRLLAIEVPVIVQLGARRLTVGEVMRLGVGAIIEFNKSAEEELDLLANNKAIGRGHAVKVGENFGIKISVIGSVKETIRKLGGV